MSIIDNILSVLTPYECLGCKAEGSLLCTDCAHCLPLAPVCCYKCRTVSPAGQTCPACSVGSPVRRVRAVSPYSGSAKQLIAALKFSGARSAARIMAERMKALVNPDDSSPLLIVPVPTATNRVRSRGYDQARLLARELCRQTPWPQLDCLARSGQTHQVGAGREQRLQQLQDAFHVRKPDAVRRQNILLVDDVVTTGATLEAAAAVLERAGSARVEAITFCAA